MRIHDSQVGEAGSIVRLPPLSRGSVRPPYDRCQAQSRQDRELGAAAMRNGRPRDGQSGMTGNGRLVNEAFGALAFATGCARAHASVRRGTERPVPARTGAGGPLACYFRADAFADIAYLACRPDADTGTLEGPAHQRAAGRAADRSRGRYVLQRPGALRGARPADRTALPLGPAGARRADRGALRRRHRDQLPDRRPQPQSGANSCGGGAESVRPQYGPPGAEAAPGGCGKEGR
jgi:hypothetical protein